MKLKLIIISIVSIFVLTGCGGNIDKDTSDFIDKCESKPGCDYKVFTDTCVCDNTHDYEQNR